MSVYESKNVYGEKLEACCTDPMTGFYRDGCCNTGDDDRGMHTVCVDVSEQFLSDSKAAGNDLSTPIHEHGFPGLKEGDRWCLCASRWLELYRMGRAPLVHLRSTHEETLAVIPRKWLEEHSYAQH